MPQPSDGAFEKWVAEKFGLEFEQRESEWRVQRAPFLAGYRAALEAVEAGMPTESFGSMTRMAKGPTWMIGWNDYRAAMSERIAALREEAKP